MGMGKTYLLRIDSICNLNCKICIQKRFLSSHKTLESLKEEILLAKQKNFTEILIGGCEPVLSNVFEPILEFTKQNDFSKIYVSTNAYNMDRETIRKYQNKINGFIVDYFILNETEFQTFTGKPFENNIIKSLNNLQSENCLFQFNFVLFDSSETELEKTISSLKTHLLDKEVFYTSLVTENVNRTQIEKHFLHLIQKEKKIAKPFTTLWSYPKNKQNKVSTTFSNVLHKLEKISNHSINSSKINKYLFSKQPQFIEEHLDIIGILSGNKSFIGPNRVEIHLTNKCNNNCLCCWVFSPLIKNNTRKAEFTKHVMSLIEFKELIDELSDLKTKSVLLSGGGEPLIHPDILPAIKYVKSKGMRCSLNTNFTLLNEQKIDELFKAEIDEIIISLWAADAKTYVTLHPNKTEKDFEKITSLIQYITKKKKKFMLPFPKLFTYNVINSINYTSVASMVSFAYDNGADSVNFTLVDSNIEDTRNLLLSKNEAKDVLHQIEKVEQISKYKNLFDKPMFDLFKLRLSSHLVDQGLYDYQSTQLTPCIAPWIFAEIFADRNVTYCTKQDRTPISNLKDESFESMWNSRKSNQFRNMCLNKTKNKSYFSNVIYCDQVCDNQGDMLHLLSIMDNLDAKNLTTLYYVSSVLQKKLISIDLEDLKLNNLESILHQLTKYGLKKIKLNLSSKTKDEITSESRNIKRLIYFCEKNNIILQFDKHQELLSIYSNFKNIACNEANFYITNNCDNKCIFCWDHSPLITHKIDNKEINFALFKKIIDDLVDHGLQSATILGNGEPTMHPEFNEMIAYAFSKKIQIRIFTNATKITEQSMSLINEFFVNISASSENEFVTIKKGCNEADFNSVLRNIEFMTKIDKKVNIINVLTKFNIDSAKEMITLGSKLNANKVILKLQSEHNVQGERLPISVNMPSKEQLQIFQTKKKHLLSYATEKQIELEFQYFEDDAVCNKSHHHDITSKTFCLSGNLKIDEYGNFYPCSFIPVKFGSLVDNSINDFKLKFKQFFLAINNPKYKDHPKFGACRKICIFDKNHFDVEIEK